MHESLWATMTAYPPIKEYLLSFHFIGSSIVVGHLYPVGHIVQLTAPGCDV